MTRNLKALGLALVAVFACSAMAASAAQANPADFAAAKTNSSIAAVGTVTQTFKTNGGTTITCVGTESNAPIEGTAALIAETNSLTVENIAFNGCHATVLRIPTTVDMNGCEFTLKSGKLVSDTHGTTAETGNTATGSMNIVNCEDKTAGITFTVGAEGSACHLDMPEQNAVSGSIHYHTETVEGIERVRATVEAIEVQIDFTGGGAGAPACPGSTSEPIESFATYNGVIRATAEDAEENPVSFTLTGTS